MFVVDDPLSLGHPFVQFYSDFLLGSLSLNQSIPVLLHNTHITHSKDTTSAKRGHIQEKVLLEAR